MYAAYFGLTEVPFSIAPDPRYLYMSPRHRDALAHLLFGMEQGGGFVQLTGEVGTGKTTLCRCLLSQLPGNVDVALILNPRINELELMQTMCDELHIDYPEQASLKVLNDRLNAHLLDAHAKGRRVVLIIDESQNLSRDVLEQVRLLTNLETTREKLLQIILIGQPELVDVLARPELRQLAQRITARYHLLSLSEIETAEYIKFRLSVAEGKVPLFSRSAVKQIFRLSKGVPRLINIICDRSLLGAYAEGERQVTPRIVQRAAKEVLGTAPAVVSTRPLWIAIPIAAVVASIAIIAWYLNKDHNTNDMTGDTASQAVASDIATPADSTEQPQASQNSSTPKPKVMENLEQQPFEYAGGFEPDLEYRVDLSGSGVQAELPKRVNPN